MIETRRLTLLPLSLNQLRLHIADNTQLEVSLDLLPGHREVDAYLLSVITHFTVPRLKDPANNPLYHTIWVAVDRQTRQIVADAKFKGEPDEDDATVEIGYGTYPAFRGRGYMTEMVGGLVRWAGQQPGVQRVVADTEKGNLASQRVLEKTGFAQFDQIDDMLWWSYSFVNRLQFNELGYLLPTNAIQTTYQTVGHYFSGNAYRVKLGQQYELLRQEITDQNVPVLFTWIDGSFVTKKSYPNDIDVVIFIPEWYKKEHFRKLTSLNRWPESIHLFWIGLRAETDSLASAINSIELANWRDLFITDRVGKKKGYLEIR